MGRSWREESCTRHPKHKLSKGVCPYCLRESLSHHLNVSSSNVSSSTSSSSMYSSDSELSSAATSPRHTMQDLIERGQIDDREQKQAMMQKSRSLAFMADDKSKKEKETNKGKFWLRLISGSKRRKVEDSSCLLHSKTTKDRTRTKWVLF